MSDKIWVTRSFLPPLEEYVDEIKDIWDSHRLTNMGEKHKRLQAMLGAYLGGEGTELFTNGHMALELSMQALGLKGEVITTPFTFASTTHAIVRNGLKPVFCDIRPDDFTIDADQIERLITEKTSAIVPVHVYGNMCEVEKIEDIARRHGLKVLYDAAHTFGVRYKGKGPGAFGDVSCFSFHATKVFHTAEGGAACYRDKELGKRLYQLKNFGIRGPEVVDGIGANAKMNEFCAAMGICNLRHIDENIEGRLKIVRRYREHLEGVPGLQLNPVQPGVRPNYAYFPVVFDEEKFGSGRDTVFRRLAEHAIFARKYFYPLTNTFDCYRGMFDAGQTPTALTVSKRVLTLPLYAELETEDVDRICEIILACKKR